MRNPKVWNKEDAYKKMETFSDTLLLLFLKWNSIIMYIINEWKIVSLFPNWASYDVSTSIFNWSHWVGMHQRFRMWNISNTLDTLAERDFSVLFCFIFFLRFSSWFSCRYTYNLHLGWSFSIFLILSHKRFIDTTSESHS